jgi:hypothetical protein
LLPKSTSAGAAIWPPKVRLVSPISGFVHAIATSRPYLSLVAMPPGDELARGAQEADVRGENILRCQ